jgi:adenylate cyclase
MYKESNTTPTSQLKSQLIQLSKLAENVYASLQPPKSTLTPQTTASLAHLAESLSDLSRKIAQREEERTNLLALADIGQVINSSLDTDEVLRIVMDTIVRLTGAERGFMMLKDDLGELEMHQARNWEQESLTPPDFEISRTIINRVVSSGEALLTTNAQEDPRFNEQESVVAYKLRSILCVPLKVKEDLIGVIYTDNRLRSGLFSESDRLLLVGFANQAAVAIENARLFDSVRRTLAEVTELKNLMDNIFSSIASGVITADEEDRITMVNQAAEKILGCDAKQMVGKPFSQSLAAIAKAINPVLELVRSEDQPYTGLEVKPELSERGLTNLRFNLAPLKDADHNTHGVTIVLDDLTEQKKLEAERKLFEKMVSPAVIAQLDPEQLNLGGKRTTITTLFADIGGFTAFSEKLSPEETVNVLNCYLAIAATAVLAQGGTVDKFMGDAVMGWFNAPVPQVDHALRAIKAALGIRQGVETLCESLPPQAHLAFSIGIHTGEAVLGLLGTETRMDYTAIGDSVNTAKRIQENCQPGQILISRQVYRQVSRYVEARRMRPLRAKGKSFPIGVFEVISLKSE